MQHFHANVFWCDNTFRNVKYFTSKYVIWMSIAPYVSNDKEITMPSDVFKRQLRSATIDSVTPENISVQMLIFLSPQIALLFDVMWLLQWAIIQSANSKPKEFILLYISHLSIWVLKQVDKVFEYYELWQEVSVWWINLSFEFNEKLTYFKQCVPNLNSHLNILLKFKSWLL